VSARFGRYELLRRLGSGGMAEVFLARFVGPEGFEKRLVIKRVLPRLSDDRRLLRMFFEEARTHVSLSHGNLVSVFDFGRVGNEYFIAMEHVPGVDLDTVLETARAAGERLPPSLCAYVGMEVCRGLAYVHRRGFVHRDVSPRNILLSVDGEVKLSDFGLVLTSASGAPVYGTLAFAAPEQARGEPVDGRSDLYALGVVLGEALAGRRLRDASTQEEALAIARAGAPIEIEGPLADVVRRATQTAPGDRYATAEEMLVALERASRGLGEGREGAMQALAARVGALAAARPEEPAPPPAPIGVEATEPAGAGPNEATADGHKRSPSARETYFRDNRSERFVEEVLAEAPAPSPPQPGSRARRAPVVAALAISAAAVVATGTLAIARLLSAPAPAPTPTATEPTPTPTSTITVTPPQPTPLQPPSPQPTAPPVTARPAPPSRPQPKPARESGTLVVQCTPWCVPYVDQVARGQDGRHHALSIPAGRHVIQARRLDDRQVRTVEIRPGRSETVLFKFD